MIPYDLIYTILDYCTILEVHSLCRLNKYFYQAIIHVLYRHVNLERTKSIGLFCRTILHGRSSLRAHPKVLVISTPWSNVGEMNTPLANSIRGALQLIPNVEDLTLFLTSAPFANIFNNSRYPFMLRRFTGPLHASAGFAKFLNEQVLLEDLNVARTPRGLSMQKIDTGAVPRLSSLSSSWETLSNLVPSRPLSNIGCSKLASNEFSAFGKLLTRSATPVRSIEVVLLRPRHAIVNLVQLFVENLQGVCDSLEHLSVTLSFSLDFVSESNSIYARLKVCSFECLKFKHSNLETVHSNTHLPKTLKNSEYHCRTFLNYRHLA